MGLWDKATASGKEPCKDYVGPAPCPIDKKTGQHADYWVLPEEERRQGFVRPLRLAYIHVGLKPPTQLRDLTDEEHERYDQFGYLKYEKYEPARGAVVGRYWTKTMLDRLGGCGVETTMGLALAETYARNPKYYGSTFCCGCGAHFPVEEFEWLDGTTVGT